MKQSQKNVLNAIIAGAMVTMIMPGVANAGNSAGICTACLCGSEDGSWRYFPLGTANNGDTCKDENGNDARLYACDISNPCPVNF